MKSIKTVKDYVKLPYTKEFIENEDGTFFIKIKELPGCMTEADTLEDAYLMIKDAMEDWIEAAIEDNVEIPLPESVEKDFSGRVALRLSKSLHRTVAENAKKDNVSLNTYLVGLIESKDAVHMALETVKSILCRGTYDWDTLSGIEGMKISASLSDIPKRATIRRSIALSGLTSRRAANIDTVDFTGWGGK